MSVSLKNEGENEMQPSGDILLSVVVPCYNEEQGIAELYRRVTATCREAVGDKYEFVLVNDGSRDHTWPMIEDFANKDPHIVGVKLSRNFGHQMALTAGLELTKGERIFILDADLQDPPELLPDMMKAMDNGADVVHGQRLKREGETWFKKATALFFYRLLYRISDLEIPLDTGDFRLMSYRVKEGLRKMPEKQRYIRGMVTWLGYKQVSIPYIRQKRYAGATKYPLLKMISFALDAITSFSISPMRISVLFALFSAFSSFCLVVYVLLSWLTREAVPGWASLGAIITSFGAIQLLMLGITGEYVGRVYVEVKNRPQYLVDKLITKNGQI